MNALELIIKILANATGMKAGFGDAEKELKGFQGRVDSVLTGIGSTLAQVFGAAQIGQAVIGVVTEANKMNTAIETLAVKIRNFNPELNKSGEEISDFANALAEGTKFLDDEVVQALDKAITKTGDYGAAQKVTADAVKLATVANIPLIQASDILSLAYQGNTRGLTALARQMGMNISEGANYVTVMEKVTQGFQGMSDVVANDLTVSLKKLKDNTSGYFEDIVKPSIPFLNTMITLIGNWVKGLVSVFQMAGASIGIVFALILSSYKQTFNAIKALATGDLKSFMSVGDDIKNAWQAAGDQFAESWGTVKKVWNGTGKPVMEEIKKTIAGIKSPPPIKIKIDTGDMVTDYINNIGEIGPATKEATDQIASEMTDAAMVSEAMANLIYQSFANSINSSIDSMIDKLVDGTGSWEEWAMNAVKSIEKVILKLLILKALETALNLLPGGNIGTTLLKSLFNLKSSPVPVSAVGQNMVVEVHTADPSTYLRFRNSAITGASVGMRNKYIQKGPQYSARK